MRQKNLTDFETSGVECPVCEATFKSNKGFGPHFRAKHPDKHAGVERVRSAYNGDPKEALEEWYWDQGMSEREIAVTYDIPREGLAKAFDVLGVEKEPWENNHAIYRTNTNGYESWRSYDPDGIDRGMKVHRLLAIAEYGIGAIKGKHVHHKNGIPWDNRPENIKPMDERDHLQEHYSEREIDDRGRFV